MFQNYHSTHASGDATKTEFGQNLKHAKQIRTAKIKEQARFRATQTATGGMEGKQS
jgi:hypothetical protein